MTVDRGEPEYPPCVLGVMAKRSFNGEIMPSDKGLRTNVPADLASFIQSDDFPCVGAKSALALGGLEVFEADEIASEHQDRDIHAALVQFGKGLGRASPPLAAFAVLFKHEAPVSEAEFERLLWTRLQRLHDVDAASGAAWAGGVSNDPASSNFAFSVGGFGFFIVGLHPGASRDSRRFCRPAMVFNPHQQFEKLRADGRYYTMQSIIRERELASHGSINPMLSDFGRGTAAAQYSGRQVEDAWACPLRIRT